MGTIDSRQPKRDPTRVIAPWRRDPIGLAVVALEIAILVLAVSAGLSSHVKDTPIERVGELTGIALGIAIIDVLLRLSRRGLRRIWPGRGSNV